MVFHYFVLNLPSDWLWQDWIKYWPSRSGEDFKTSSMYFSLCPYHIPLDIGYPIGEGSISLKKICVLMYHRSVHRTSDVC